MNSINQIASALVKAQSEMSNAKKGSNNPFFKSKYADLNSIREAVIPVLNSHGISVLQPTFTENGKNYVKTILLHESGEYLESLTEVIFAKQNDAQAQGSGISYARRYGLQSFVCIGADDDDGNKANEQPKPKKDISSTSPEIPMLTNEQYDKAINSDLKGIEATLKAIESKKILATTEQYLMLQNKQIELKKQTNE